MIDIKPLIKALDAVKNYYFDTHPIAVNYNCYYQIQTGNGVFKYEVLPIKATTRDPVTINRVLRKGILQRHKNAKYIYLYKITEN